MAEDLGPILLGGALAAAAIGIGAAIVVAGQPPPPPGGNVATGLSITVLPNPALVGQPAAVTGKLVRSDTGAVLTGALITFEGSDDGGITWWFAGGYLTDAGGVAHGGTVFTWPGSKLIHALFAPSGPYAGSKSTDQPHVVTGLPPGPP